MPIPTKKGVPAALTKVAGPSKVDRLIGNYVAGEGELVVCVRIGRKTLLVIAPLAAQAIYVYMDAVSQKVGSLIP